MTRLPSVTSNGSGIRPGISQIMMNKFPNYMAKGQSLPAPWILKPLTFSTTNSGTKGPFYWDTLQLAIGRRAQICGLRQAALERRNLIGGRRQGALDRQPLTDHLRQVTLDRQPQIGGLIYLAFAGQPGLQCLIPQDIDMAERFNFIFFLTHSWRNCLCR